MKFFNALIFIIISLIIMMSSGTGICYGENDHLVPELEGTNYVQIITRNDKVSAVRNHQPAAVVNLKMGEQVLVSKEDGHVGAVLTDQRFLAVSSGSASWSSEPLAFDEAEMSELLVGEEIVILITDERILGFNRVANRVVQYHLPMDDNVLAKNTGKTLGIVVTDDRAVGFSSTSADFKEIRFDFGADFQSLEVAAEFALVHTRDKIYVFRSAIGEWTVR